MSPWRNSKTNSAMPRGFTLIEALIAMAVLAILAAIGVPQYTRYVQRGNLVEATNALAEFRVRMEQFYQDNRTYAAGGGCGAAPPSGLQNFTITCATANGGQTYVATATGAGSTAGFVYTIDQANARRTTGLPADWGTVPDGGINGWKTK